MSCRRLPGLLAVVSVAALATACGGKGAGGAAGAAMGGAGGAAGGAAGAAGGATGAAGAAGGGAGTGGVGGAAAQGWGACDLMPAPLRTSGTILELPIAPVLEGQPFVHGEPNVYSTGGTITPLNFRFYVSEVQLLTAGGGTVPVDLVTGDGLLQPYDVHLFIAEDAASHTPRVLAPPGTYTGVSFLLGLNAACNTPNANGRMAPLSATSQMTWPPIFGYLFLRYEARFSADGQDAGAGAAPPPLIIHMGGTPNTSSAPVIRVDGSLTVPATGSVTRGMRVAIDQIFAGATADIDVTGTVLPGEEVEAGERLRRTAAGLPLFSFAP